VAYGEVMNRTTKTTLQYVTFALPFLVLAIAMFFSFVFPLAGCALLLVWLVLFMLSIFFNMWAVKATWTGRHRGSTIRVYNELTLAQLFVDDQLLAQQTGFAFSADLRGTATIDGQSANVVGSIAGTFVLSCRCYVDGTAVVMTELET